jgi:DNA-binding protein HU-beta
MVQAVARVLETSRAKAARVVDLFFGNDGLIAAELRKGGKVQISGFGNFETRKRAARQVRNPRTGKAITIKASVAPVFRAGKGLKQAVTKAR